MPATLTRRQGSQAGATIRKLRLNKGYSPEALGYEIGVSGRTIRRVEDGMVPTVNTMFALAKWADLEVVDLWRL